MSHRLEAISSIGGTRLGRRSLQLEQKAWEERCNASKPGRSVAVYHRGDVPYESDIGNIVGVVAYQPCRESSNPEYLLKRVKPEINIRELSDIDHVFMGLDFSEPKPDACKKKGSKRDRR